MDAGAGIRTVWAALFLEALNKSLLDFSVPALPYTGRKLCINQRFLNLQLLKIAKRKF
ncbi:MAG: hypothetical protein HW386_1490 [Gammaproteobacteria bacterium]|nr:hypothetical protein [Gammaproteobacteria bacterium]